MNKITRKEFIVFGLVLVFSGLLVFVWFSPFNYHVFIGDDLFWIKNYHLSMPVDGFWYNAFTIANGAGKFRPIPNILILLVTGICKDSFDCFVGIQFLMVTINAFLASIVAYRLTSKWAPAVLITSTLIILSRFAYYAALQVMGIMESLAMTFMLLLVLCFIQFTRVPNIKWIVRINLLFLAILLTHERFIVLIVPVTYILLAKRKDLSKSQFITSLSFLILTTIGYFLIREYGFHSRFLTGAGSSSIVDTFHVSQIALYIRDGVLNLLGFNVGPDYLSGKYFLDAGLGGILFGGILSGSLFILFLLFLKQQMRKNVEIEFDLIICLVLMLGGMILASSITFRQEYRWLYTPFVILILLVCYFLSKIENLKTKYALMLLVIISFASVDIFYRQYMNNVYFLQSSQMASSVKKEMIDNLSSAELKQKEIYLLIPNETVRNWVLADNYFFELYSKIPTMNIHYITDLNEIPFNSVNDNQPLVFSFIGTQIVSVSPTALLDRNLDLQNNTVIYDFISNYSSATLNDNAHVSTPTGRGGFLMNWQDDQGITSETITIVSSFSIQYSSIVCQAGSNLIFQAGIPYKLSDGADLFIMTESNGIEHKVTEISLEPGEKDAILTWNDYNIPLADCSGEKIDITFGVDSPSGNQTADWIALASIKLVVKK